MQPKIILAIKEQVQELIKCLHADEVLQKSWGHEQDVDAFVGAVVNAIEEAEIEEQERYHEWCLENESRNRPEGD